MLRDLPSPAVRLLGMVDDLSIHVSRYLTGEAHSNADDLLSIESREIAEDLVRTERQVSGRVCRWDPCNPGKEGESWTHLGLLRMSARSKTSCATMQRMFRCGP